MSIDVMKQALEAFEWNYNTDLDNIPACEQWAKMLKANITTLRAAIEQAQEPVAWMRHVSAVNQGWDAIGFERAFDDDTPLYTTPQQEPSIKWDASAPVLLNNRFTRYADGSIGIGTHTIECPRCGHCCPRQVECMCGICKLKPANREPVAWRKHYENSGYTYFDKRWGTIPDGAEPLFSD